MRTHPIVSEAAPISIALLEAAKDIAEPFSAIAESCGILPRTYIAPYLDMPALAKDIERTVDVIMCRTGTAEHVAKAVSIPVIAIPITSFDVMCALYHLKEKVGNVAVFCHKKTFAGIDVLEQLFGCSIHQYAFLETDEIPHYAREASRRGVECCFGGAVTFKYAHQFNMRAILVSPNEDSIFRSVREALKVAKVRREDRTRTAWLEVVFDAITQGIVVTDNDGKIIVYNGAAQRICKIVDSSVVGKDIRDVVRDPEISAHFVSEEHETSNLKTIHGKAFAFRKRPVLLDNGPIGTVSTLEDVTKIQHLEELIRNQMHSKGLRPKYRFDDILGCSDKIVECKTLAKRYAPTSASIVIEGESGTGKEMFAQSIHNASNRASGPFVAVNCAAIPETLLESELFGYEGGAFTGAKKDGKQGLFEQAHKGTIFLDEIGEIAASLQARLLRVLQEREVRRVGGDKIISVDIRIISATNKNLLQKVEQGQFRDDLFYRLNVLHLKIPPLRERKEDIGMLAEGILRKFRVDASSEVLGIIGPMLTAYDWPGNIRELHNILERLSLLAVDACEPADWGEMLQQALHVPVEREPRLQVALDMSAGLKDVVRQVEKKVLTHMLAKHNNDFGAVAAILKIGRTSAWRKIRH